VYIGLFRVYIWLLCIYTALLNVCRSFLSKRKALSRVYRAHFSVCAYRAHLSVCRALLSILGLF